MHLTKLQKEIAQRLITRMKEEGGSTDWNKYASYASIHVDTLREVVSALIQENLILPTYRPAKTSIKLTEKGKSFSGFEISGKKKNIFVSYFDTDRSKMRILETVINKTTFFDPKIIADNREPLKALTEKVRVGIFESDYVIPILTKNSVSSQWVNQEIGCAIGMNKEILPIIESNLMDNLKGFIHKNMDLSYNFSEGTGKNNLSSSFRKVCNILLNDLLRQNNHIPLHIDFEYLFSGLWKSTYTATHLGAGTEDIEVKGNKYYSNGIHRFNLRDLDLNEDRTAFSFTKIDVKKKHRIFRNNLLVGKVGEYYLGTEFDDQRRPVSITYSKN